jgi:putative membrane protein
MPVAGRDAVAALIEPLGIADPEDTSVNCLLEALRVADDLRAEGDDPVLAVVAGAEDGPASPDRAIATQLEELLATHTVDSAIVVTDSATDEQAVPIIESRLPVDSVDRVIVRQARDIESTYYLLKQFLADEELRTTVLVPIGVTLVVFPVLQLLASTAVAVAVMSAVIGAFLLYKGLGIDDYVEDMPAQVQEALYSGQVSIVTYVVAGGLALVGVFVGALAASDLSGTYPAHIPAMEFGYDAIPWVATAALVASAGRLIDDTLRHDDVRSSSVNLPFVILAVGLVVRGFSGYFLERAGVLDPLSIAPLSLGALSIRGFTVPRGTRLALFIMAGMVVSLVGVRAATYLETAVTDPFDTDPERPDS